MMENQNSPQIYHLWPASFGDRIICLRLQVYMMNCYCGLISAGNLWVSLDKWEVAAVKTREYDTLLVKKNMSPTIFFFRDQHRMHETVMTLLYNPTHLKNLSLIVQCTARHNLQVLKTVLGDPLRKLPNLTITSE